MTNDQRPETLEIIESLDTEVQLASLKAFADYNGMRAMQLLARDVLDPETIRDEDIPFDDVNANLEEQLNVEKEREAEFERTNRAEQGHDVQVPRVELIRGHMELRNWATDEIKSLNGNQFNEPMDAELLFKYGVMSMTQQNVATAQKTATAVGTTVNVHAALQQRAAEQSAKLETAHHEAIARFNDAMTFAESTTAAFHTWDPRQWHNVDVKIADALLKQRIRIAHNAAGYMHLVSPTLELYAIGAHEFLTDAERVVKANLQAITELLGRGAGLRSLTPVFVYKDIPYSCKDEYTTWQAARALLKTQAA